MSAKYDLYETPDVQNTGEQQPLHARIVPSGTYSKSFWNVCPTLPKHLIIM